MHQHVDGSSSRQPRSGLAWIFRLPRAVRLGKIASMCRSQLARGTSLSPVGQTLGRALSPLGDQGGESQCRHQGRRGVWTAGALNIRRSLSPSGDQGGESPQTPRAVPSPSVPQGRFRGRRKDPLGGRGVGKFGLGPFAFPKPAGSKIGGCPWFFHTPAAGKIGRCPWFLS